MLTRMLGLSGQNPPELVGTTQVDANVGGATTLNLTTPAGTGSGDLLIAFMYTTTGSSQTWSNTSGFTECFDSNLGGPNISVAYRNHDGATSVWPFTYSGAGKDSTGVMLAYKYAAFESTSTVYKTGSIPALTFANNDSLLLVFGAIDEDLAITLAGFTAVFSDAVPSNSRSGAVLSKLVNAGSSGAISAPTNAAQYAAIGLKPTY